MLTRSAIISRGQALLKALKTSKGTRQKLILNDIKDFVIQYPQSVEIFKTHTKDIRDLSKSKDDNLGGKARQTLALMGYAEPPKAPGVRVLSIDGGGTRGIVSMEILRHIEQSAKKRIHELFDLICGVSSGAIITMAIGSGRFDIDQCEKFYRSMSEDVFKTDLWTSTPRLLLSHAYYDASVYERTLKKIISNTSLLHLAREADRPKLAAVAVNAHTMQPFLFRTYAHDPSIGHLFEGTCKADIWQALRASSAAPGYFEEFKFESSMLLDGGILVNNCTGVALAEAHMLWPKEAIQCIVSVGSGRFRPRDVSKASATSLYEKAYGLVYSATDTETMHMIAQSSIKNYYRLNPTLSESIFISEIRKLKLDQLTQEAKQYMLDNDYMLKHLVKKLLEPRPLYQRTLDLFQS